MSRGIQSNRENGLKYEGQNETDFSSAEIGRRAFAGVAQRRLAAGGARVQFRAFPDDDAAGLAFVRALSLQRPHHWLGRGILRTRRERKSLYLR